MGERAGTILVVDGAPHVRERAARTLRGRGYRVELAAGPEEARAALDSTQLDACLCDLDHDGAGGLELALEIAAGHRDVALVVTSGSQDFDVAEQTLELGAYDYLLKPFRAAELVITVANALRRARLERDSAELRRTLEETVDARTLELAFSREETIHRLARAVEFRDASTGLHVERMSAYCRLVALRAGLPPARASVIRTASLLHDIGKVATPDRILVKPGPLSREERQEMHEHTTIGHRILAGSVSELIQTAATIAFTHHERYDGGGYPRGLHGEEIPIEGRIAAVCDVFDALTSSRPYRLRAFTRDEALAVLRAGRGKAFDPVVADGFLGGLDEVDRIRTRYSDVAGDGALSAA